MSRAFLPPRGFLSYVREDDALIGHRITQLCEAITRSLKFHLGQSADIFQDTTKLGHGTRWLERTKAAIAEASFFIPILTPAYLNSEWCSWELREFRGREKALLDGHPPLAGGSLIFPINLTNVDETDPDERGVFDDLRQLQHLAFGDMLYGDLDRPPARTAITRFVADIRILLRTPIDPAEPFPPQLPQTPEPTPSPSPSPSPSPAEATPVKAEAVKGVVVETAVVALPDAGPAKPKRTRRSSSGVKAAPSLPSPPPPSPPDEADDRAAQTRRQRMIILVSGSLIAALTIVAIIASKPGPTYQNYTEADYTANLTNDAMAIDMAPTNGAVDTNAALPMNTAAAVSTHGVSIRNDCPRPIRLYLHYQRAGAWQDPSGPWLLDGNSETSLLDGAANIQASNSQFYFHAETTDGSGLSWGVGNTRQFRGTNFETNLTYADINRYGEYVIPLTCPSTTSPPTTNTANMM